MSAPTIGYLLVLRDEGCSYCGGYLLVTATGRPVEFHCTAPVRPNRAQEILFGASLDDYVVGQVIGPALLAKSKLAPAVVLVQEVALGAAGQGSEMAIEVLAGEPDRAVELLARHAALAELAGRIDLREPFERIVLALRETQRLSSEAPTHVAA